MSTGREDHENVEDRQMSDANPRAILHASDASDSVAEQTPTLPPSGISTKPPPDATPLHQHFPPDEEVPETTAGTEGPLTPGRILFGKYEIIRVLGEGGMGMVLLVLHHKLGGVERALKLIGSKYASNRDLRARFRREARSMALLVHPHIVVVHDADIPPVGDEAYIEMEFVRGQSLATLLNARRPHAPGMDRAVRRATVRRAAVGPLNTDRAPGSQAVQPDAARRPVAGSCLSEDARLRHRQDPPGGPRPRRSRRHPAGYSTGHPQAHEPRAARRRLGDAGHPRHRHLLRSASSSSRF